MGLNGVKRVARLGQVQEGGLLWDREMPEYANGRRSHGGRRGVLGNAIRLNWPEFGARERRRGEDRNGRRSSFLTANDAKYANRKGGLGRLVRLSAMGTPAPGRVRRVISAATGRAWPGSPGSRFRPFDCVLSMSLHTPVIAWNREKTYPSVGSIGSIVLFLR